MQSYLLDYHYEALHVTGIIDNLGPDAELGLQLLEYLESTESGCSYLYSICWDPVLKRYFSDKSLVLIQCTLIGRLWFAIQEHHDEGLELENPAGRPIVSWTDACRQCIAGTQFGNTLCYCHWNINRDDTNSEHSDDSEETEPTGIITLVEDTNSTSSSQPDQPSSSHPGAPADYYTRNQTA